MSPQPSTKTSGGQETDEDDLQISIPSARARGGREVRLAAGLALIAVLATFLRSAALAGHLPGVAYADEGAIVGWALALLNGSITPPDFGWPPASIQMTALVIAMAREVPSLLESPADVYLLAREAFVSVSVVAVVLAGVMGAALSDTRERVPMVAWGAGVAFAISYLSVRLGRQIHPDHLQAVFVMGSFLCVLAFDRSRRWFWLAGSGALAGLAGAAKYLGVLVAIPALISVLWAGPAKRFRHLALLGVTAVLGFLAGSPGTILDFDRFLGGVLWQMKRQATGHLGYEAEGNGWWFHAAESLGGNWGPWLTALSLAGMAWVLVRGSRAQRLAVSFALPVFLLIGTFRAQFPHYVLVLLGFLAPLAFVAAARLGERIGRRGPAVAAALLALSLLPTLLHDVRLIRTSGAPETRVLAADVISRLPGKVWAESYSAGLDTRDVDRSVESFGQHSEVLACNCFAVVSSYMEERFRRRGDLYAAQIRVYDAIRRQGRVVRVVKPWVNLSYRWDLLPQWGLGNVPLWGPVGRVGPTITIFDLRRSVDGREQRGAL